MKKSLFSGVIALATVISSGASLAAPVKTASLLLTADQQTRVIDAFAGDFNLKFRPRNQGTSAEELSTFQPALTGKNIALFEDISYVKAEVTRHAEVAPIPAGFDLILRAFFTDRNGHRQASLSADLAHFGQEPLEAALPLLGFAMAGLGFLGWRRKKDLLKNGV